MKTYSQKTSEISREWWLIDASTLPLGKLAVVIADKLMGKSKVTYTPHIDNGDYVVVINAKSLKVTGDKMTDKHYYSHSGFPGGLKDLTLAEIIEKNPARSRTNCIIVAYFRYENCSLRLVRIAGFCGGTFSKSCILF